MRMLRGRVDGIGCHPRGVESADRNISASLVRDGHDKMIKVVDTGALPNVLLWTPEGQQGRWVRKVLQR